MMNKDEFKGLVTFWIILILIVLGAFLIAGNSNDQSPDPQCSTVGNC